MEENSKESLKKLLKQCLQKQVDELDMLQSIFCNTGELKIDDHSIAADINEFLEDKIGILNSQLEYTIRLEYKCVFVDVHFQLPHLYPLLESANVTVRSSLYSKTVESIIKQRLDEYINDLDNSEVYIYQVITWIQENIESFDIPSAALEKTMNKTEGNDVKMERLWIYSHHIKCKTKRHDIVKYAKELNLSGFLRPGKPGIICVEGLRENTEKFWKFIKSMQWYKITIRKSETKTKCYSKLDAFRKFTGFREELFTDIGGDVNEVVMNMSLFIKYLELHNCAYMKKELFGFD